MPSRRRPGPDCGSAWGGARGAVQDGGAVCRAQVHPACPSSFPSVRRPPVRPSSVCYPCSLKHLHKNPHRRPGTKGSTEEPRPRGSACVQRAVSPLTRGAAVHRRLRAPLNIPDLRVEGTSRKASQPRVTLAPCHGAGCSWGHTLRLWSPHINAGLLGSPCRNPGSAPRAPSGRYPVLLCGTCVPCRLTSQRGWGSALRDGGP